LIFPSDFLFLAALFLIQT